MATQLPGIPPYTTLLQFYDNPPVGNISTQDAGSSSTAPMAPSNPPHERVLPRHVLGDHQMCQTITNAARTHLAGLTPQLVSIPIAHAALGLGLNSMTGNETINSDIFAYVTNYVRNFVEEADGLNQGAVQSTACQNVNGIRPNRVFVRNGVERVIVELKSVAAFNEHVTAIQTLAQANGGRGTEMIFDGFSLGAESILLKLGHHMINRGCVWGLIVGGNDYLAVYLDHRNDNGDVYYHMVVSPIHACFPASAAQGTPSLTQVLIALLLGPPATIQYSPPRVAIGTRYLGGKGGYRKAKHSSTSKTQGNSRQPPAGGSQHRSVQGQRPQVRPEALLDSAQFCALIFPNSGLPARELALARVSATQAVSILSGDYEGIPETDPYAHGPHSLISRGSNTCKLFGLEELGSGITGIVYDSVCSVDNDEVACAAKVVQYEFSAVPNEVTVYEALRGKDIAPEFYATFAGVWVTGPIGVIVMERLERTFDSFEEMSAEEKLRALECVKELHRAGFHHGDLSARHFGVRGHQIVTFDFSHTYPCRPCDAAATDTCFVIQRLESILFGDEREV